MGTARRAFLTVMTPSKLFRWPAGLPLAAFHLLAGLLLAGLLLGGCAGPHPQEAPLPQMAVTREPTIGTDPVSGERSVELSVLIYNVHGLPWPFRRTPGQALDRIGEELAGMRAAGQEPDIVLLQEAFIPRAARIGERAGYPNRVRGPRRRDPSPPASPDIDPEFLENRRFLKGERAGKVVSSGLYALSNYPIVEKAERPFKQYECAGYDCLANKGVLLVRVQVPGVPVPVDIMTTHLNAQRASGVSLKRALYAHNRQIDEIDDFLDTHRDPRNPLIFGGDFNMRGARERLDYAMSRRPYPFVRYYCTVTANDCDVRMSWDGDEPWLATQDLQGFDDGACVAVRPVRVAALFDEPVPDTSDEPAALRGRLLSDHDGYLVVYRLSWPAPGATAAGCPPV